MEHARPSQLGVAASVRPGAWSKRRKTAARAPRELVDLGVIQRVGQLKGWRDEENAHRRGADVYSLNVTCRKLGQLAERSTRRTAGLMGGLSGDARSALVLSSGRGRGSRLWRSDP